MLLLGATEPFASTLHPNAEESPYLDHNLDKIDDVQMEKVVRERVETLSVLFHPIRRNTTYFLSRYHPTSSARMAPLAEGGVVDGYLRVYGIANLRVADASVFPTLISGHTVSILETSASYVFPILSISDRTSPCCGRESGRSDTWEVTVSKEAFNSELPVSGIYPLDKKGDGMVIFSVLRGCDVCTSTNTLYGTYDGCMELRWVVGIVQAVQRSLCESESFLLFFSDFLKHCYNSKLFGVMLKPVY
jgi:hypothetical protein